jgi:hypothetical protein
MPQKEFEPAIPARERLQTHALDHATTGLENILLLFLQNKSNLKK